MMDKAVNPTAEYFATKKLSTILYALAGNMNHSAKPLRLRISKGGTDIVCSVTGTHIILNTALQIRPNKHFLPVFVLIIS